MITDFLIYLQGLTGGYITPYGFYVAVDGWYFIFFKDIVIGVLAFTSLWYYVRYRRARVHSKQPAPQSGMSLSDAAFDFPHYKKKGSDGGKFTRPGSGPRAVNKTDVSRNDGVMNSNTRAARRVIPTAEEVLDAALETGREVYITYHDGTGDFTERKILPRRRYVARGREYLYAWCFLRGDERTFRMDRIGGAVFADPERRVL